MNLFVTLEALKIYRMKAEKLVQIMFVVLFIVNAGIWFLPFVDRDFSGFFAAVDEMAAGRMSEIVLTRGNWLLLILTGLVQLINLIAVFIYAAQFASERMPSVERSLGRMSLHALPRLLLIALLLIVPAIMSVMLMMIPLLVFVFMMYFLPINLLLHRQSIAYAMHKSFEQTKGFRLLIFFQVFFLSLILTFPESIIIGFMPDNFIATVMIQSFFAVYLALSQGRLMGIYYLYLVKKDPLVVPSFPNNEDKGK
jgi:hypothetical protein